MSDLDQFAAFEEPEKELTNEERIQEAVDHLNDVEQLRQLLELEAARDFLWRLLAKCHVFGSVYSKHSGEMYFLEGERNIGLWLGKEIVTANPRAFALMREKAEQLASEAGRRELERAADLKRQSEATP